YERVGDVSKVVFPNGWVMDEATGVLSLYYGAADSVVALATANLSDIMTHVLTMPPPQRRRASDWFVGRAPQSSSGCRRYLSVPRPSDQGRPFRMGYGSRPNRGGSVRRRSGLPGRS